MRLVLVKSILVECCKDANERIYEVSREDDLQLLIAITENKTTRKLRRYADNKAEFDRLASCATCYEVELTCTATTKQYLKDEISKVILLEGGNRSMKSHTAAQIGFRQWMLRGGPEHEFALIGQQLKHAKRLLKKWIRSDPPAPPIFPKELVAYYPAGHERDQCIRMIDGSVFWLLDGKPNKIEGLSLQ